MAKISIALPIHHMDNAEFFARRCLDSIFSQSFKDFDVVITDNSPADDHFLENIILHSYPNKPISFTKNDRIGMAQNTNAAMKNCTGEIIKILYLDDYLAGPDALKHIADAFTPETMWVASGCEHDDGDGYRFSEHRASFHGILEGKNTIGSPSVVAIRNGLDIRFDEQMTWLLDVDLYKRLYATHKALVIIDAIDVVIGVGEHQTTHILSDAAKLNEEIYLNKKHV